MKQVIRHVIPQEIFVKTNKFVAMVYFESFRSSLACSSPHPAEILEWDLATHCAKLFKEKLFVFYIGMNQAFICSFHDWLVSWMCWLVDFFLHFPHKKTRNFWVFKFWGLKILLFLTSINSTSYCYLFNFWCFYFATTTTTFSITWKIEKPRN